MNRIYIPFVVSFLETYCAYEFDCFEESLKQVEIRLFSDGAPVQSTVSLTEGHFGIAVQLMA